MAAWQVPELHDFPLPVATEILGKWQLDRRGLTLHDFHGFSASLRLRYFGPRDLTSDGQYQSSQTILLNAEAGYQINKTWRVSVELLNLLDRHDHDIDYAYTSQVTPASQPRFQDVFHPVEPFQVRVGLTAKF